MTKSIPTKIKLQNESNHRTELTNNVPSVYHLQQDKSYLERLSNGVTNVPSGPCCSGVWPLLKSLTGPSRPVPSPPRLPRDAWAGLGREIGHVTAAAAAAGLTVQRYTGAAGLADGRFLLACGVWLSLDRADQCGFLVWLL